MSGNNLENIGNTLNIRALSLGNCLLKNATNSMFSLFHVLMEFKRFTKKFKYNIRRKKFYYCKKIYK